MVRHVYTRKIPLRPEERSMELVFCSRNYIGRFIAASFFNNPNPVNLNPKLVAGLHRYGIAE
jgi:hypothetical protein